MKQAIYKLIIMSPGLYCLVSAWGKSPIRFYIYLLGLSMVYVPLLIDTYGSFWEEE